MKRAILLLLGVLTAAFNAALMAAENNVAIDRLGNLSLSFTQVTPVHSVTKGASTGQVAILPGAALRITAPMNPQQVDYLVVDGEFVDKQQRIARLSGSEVHHYRDNLAAKKALMSLTKGRFDRNKELIVSKAISQEKWLTISQQFYDAQLSWGHLNHFAEMFEPHDDDVGYLLAPVSGVFRLPQATTLSEETLLGTIVNPDAIRLTTLINAADANSAASLSTDMCKVGIQKIEQISERFLVRVWSQALPETCDLQLGEQVTLTAQLTLSGFILPAASLFYWHGQSSVFIHDNDALSVVSVDAVGQAGPDQIVVAAQAISANDKVLSSSVSAVQGILLGLGDTQW